MSHPSLSLGYLQLVATLEGLAGSSLPVGKKSPSNTNSNIMQLASLSPQIVGLARPRCMARKHCHSTEIRSCDTSWWHGIPAAAASPYTTPLL